MKIEKEIPCVLDYSNLPNWKSFVERHFVVNSNCKIRKSIVLRLAGKYFNPFKISERNMIKELIAIGIHWNKATRQEGEKGCFIGLSIRPK